jgi:hypothetical protein
MLGNGCGVWWVSDIDGRWSHIVRHVSGGYTGCVGGVKHLSANLRIKAIHFAQMLNPYPFALSSYPIYRFPFLHLSSPLPKDTAREAFPQEIREAVPQEIGNRYYPFAPLRFP